MDNKLSLGINVSIILTLTILTGLLVLPLKLLFNTHYESQDGNNNNSNSIKDNNNLLSTATIDSNEIIIDVKKLKLCPGEYKYIVKSIFSTHYDGNCTYKYVERIRKSDNTQNFDQKQIYKIDDNDNSINYNNVNPGIRIIKPKSVAVTDYILVIMLIVSVLGAFIEFLRIRFTNKQPHQDKYSSVEGIASKKQSMVEMMLMKKCNSRRPMKTQLSVDVPTSNKSVRVSGSRAPPLIRRSSFPAYFNLDNGGSDALTPPRSPRRPSIALNADSEIGACTSPVLHHRSRLIRRH